MYLDNVAASGRILGDLVPDAEMKALRRIEGAHVAGHLKMVTSRQSWREQERTRDPVKRATLESARGEVSVVATDHTVLGFSSGSTTTSFVTDIVDAQLFDDLKSIGLDDEDAKHLMYAVTNGCDVFVTLDPHFLDRRVALEVRCPSLRILKLSKFAAEL